MRDSVPHEAGPTKGSESIAADNIITLRDPIETRNAAFTPVNAVTKRTLLSSSARSSIGDFVDAPCIAMHVVIPSCPVGSEQGLDYDRVGLRCTVALNAAIFVFVFVFALPGIIFA